MFYGQCWKCGERWELGTASTCKCPEETTIEWTEAKLPSPVLTLDTKPNYNITYYRDGIQVGVLDFNGPEMVFTGNADESAKIFFDFIAGWFKARLEQERADERDRLATKLVQDFKGAFGDDTCASWAVWIRGEKK